MHHPINTFQQLSKTKNRHKEKFSECNFPHKIKKNVSHENKIMKTCCANSLSVNLILNTFLSPGVAPFEISETIISIPILHKFGKYV